MTPVCILSPTNAVKYRSRNSCSLSSAKLHDPSPTPVRTSTNLRPPRLSITTKHRASSRWRRRCCCEGSVTVCEALSPLSISSPRHIKRLSMTFVCSFNTIRYLSLSTTGILNRQVLVIDLSTLVLQCFLRPVFIFPLQSHPEYILSSLFSFIKNLRLMPSSSAICNLSCCIQRHLPLCQPLPTIF